MKFFWQALLVLFLASLAIQYWYISLIVAAIIFGPRLVRYVLMRRYFASEEFLAHKAEIASVVAEHNEISDYVNEIKSTGKFTVGESESGSQSHLATFTNTSNYAYKRDRNVADFSANYVHNASLQVVRNASIEPIKYLMKYFDLGPTEENLNEVESLAESISRLEGAIANLKGREKSIATDFAPPSFITKYYLEEFQKQVGLHIPELKVPYPSYVFQYLSAGGNSGQKTVVVLNSETLDSLMEAISEKIKFKKSAAGQRSLMTVKFREFIKTRDEFACKLCSISVYQEPHLLLEVDHIVPVSKGGLSTEENLQTLCWKCNRTKASK